MPGCSGHLRFLAALPPKGWCRNDDVCGRRLAILLSDQSIRSSLPGPLAIRPETPGTSAEH